MNQTVVSATRGRERGSRPSRRLRAEGMLPGVVYGPGGDPIPVAVDYAELRDALKTDAGMNTVLQLEVADHGTETVLVYEVQRDPIKRVVTHADFLRIDPDKPITVGVPINLVGEPTAVYDEGGVIEQSIFELDVEVSPMRIPNSIDVDVSQMTMDTAISVGDLPLPDGVTTAVGEEVGVVSAVLPRAARMEGEEGEEGEETDAEGEGGDDAEASADADADGDGGDDGGDE